MSNETNSSNFIKEKEQNASHDITITSSRSLIQQVCKESLSEKS